MVGWRGVVMVVVAVVLEGEMSDEKGGRDGMGRDGGKTSLGQGRLKIY